MEDAARKSADAILKVIKANLRAISGGRVRALVSGLWTTADSLLRFKLSISGIFTSLASVFSGPKRSQGHEFMEKLLASGRPIDELANSILSVAVVATVELSQGDVDILLNVDVLLT